MSKRFSSSPLKCLPPAYILKRRAPKEKADGEEALLGLLAVHWATGQLWWACLDRTHNWNIQKQKAAAEHTS